MLLCERGLGQGGLVAIGLRARLLSRGGLGGGCSPAASVGTKLDILKWYDLLAGLRVRYLLILLLVNLHLLRPVNWLCIELASLLQTKLRLKSLMNDGRDVGLRLRAVPHR